MKLGAVLLLQVLVTGAAVFAYDSLRGDRSPAPVEAPRHEAAPDIVREKPEAPQTPLLSGSGWSDLVRRVQALEERPASAGNVSAILGVDPEAPSGVATPNEAAAPAEGADGPPASAQFDEKQIAKFRVLLDEVEKRRREERQLENFRDLMKRVEVNLTSDQEKRVIAARTAYTEKRAEMFRTIRTDGTRPDANDREKRLAAAKDLRDEYGRALETIVPAADAQKILDATARFPQDARQRGPDGRMMGGFTPPDGPDR